MGAATAASGVMECDSAGSFVVFPFVDDFERVAKGEISFEYLRDIRAMLMPAIDMLGKHIEGPGFTSTMVRTLVYCVAAHARATLALLYEPDVVSAGVVDCVELSNQMIREWEIVVERDGIMFTTFAPCVAEVLGPAIVGLWQNHARENIVTAGQLAQRYGRSVSTLRVVVVGQLLVESSGGRLLCDLVDSDLVKPVIPADLYRQVIQCVSSVRKVHDTVEIEHLRDTSFGSEYGCSTRAMREWTWLVLSTTEVVRGYCYQQLYPPDMRYATCEAMGRFPLVADIVWGLESMDMSWAPVPAEIVDNGYLHVVKAGWPDIEYLSSVVEKHIGLPALAQEPDYFARGLVDEFIRKHRADKPKVVPPVDDSIECQWSVVRDIRVSPGFVGASEKLYAGVGEALSPRAASAPDVPSGLVSWDEHTTELDSDRVKALSARLVDGAVIDESYFLRSRRRLMRRVQRPSLDASEGNCYHVFSAFGADGGGTTGCWELDTRWDVPGWTSYVAEFSNEKRVVAFLAPEHATDVRIDCSGDGYIEMGDCRVEARSTVLWFSKSIKLQVKTTGRVCLRVSVPDSGGAVAVGADMRRYMHLPGYAVVVRSFGLNESGNAICLSLERERSMISGCEIRSGYKRMERGRHRFKLSNLASMAPVKMVLKTDPVEALYGLTVCGMRLKPGSRSYVAVLFDPRNVAMYVALEESARVHVSVLQIVRVRDFDKEIDDKSKIVNAKVGFV